MHRASRTTRLVSVVAGTILAATTLAGCGQINSLLGGSQRDADTQEVTEEGTDSVFDIQVGDCLLEPEGAGSTGTEVYDINVVPCADTHDYEFYHEFDLSSDDDAWPGDDAIAEQADPGCYDSFETFVGVPFDESATLWYTYYSPTSQSWDEGDRAIQCMVYEASDDQGVAVAQVEGSLEGAAR